MLMSSNILNLMSDIYMYSFLSGTKVLLFCQLSKLFEEKGFVIYARVHFLLYKGKSWERVQQKARAFISLLTSNTVKGKKNHGFSD